MTIVSIFSGDYCHADEVARGVAHKLGCALLGSDLLDGAARRSGLTAADLLRAITGPPFAFDRFTHKRERCLAILREALAAALREDIVCVGPVVHMIPRGINHVLRVCLSADPVYRADALAKARGVPPLEARQMVKDADLRLAEWTQYLLNASPWDKSLYDIKIPMDAQPVETAVKLICENARKAVLQATEESRMAVDDFRIAAVAGSALARAGHFNKVECVSGSVTVVVEEYALSLERLEREFREILSGAGGGMMSVRAGAHYRPAAVFAPLEFELPSKILLVDDEKDFVLTLSERLEMRDMAPVVAYDGEQALSILQEEEPEVIVLDLKMPGIDGMEVLRRVKKEHPAVEVIILTGHGNEKDRELCMQLGAFAYLEKPVDIETLSLSMTAAYEKIRSRKPGVETPPPP
ncbi:MAG: response regulator [Actinomycetota bacterium]